MQLIFHGELRKLYGERATMVADTVAEAIEGFSRQQANWPREMRISVVGFDTEEKLKTAADVVHLMPAMAGGGGKFGTILLGAAMIGLAFTGIGTLAVGMKAAMLISGAVMIAQGVVGLFLKAPSLAKNADPDASKYLGVNQNTTAVGTPIIMAWGRILISPHWLSLQSDSTNLSYGVFPANPQ